VNAGESDIGSDSGKSQQEPETKSDGEIPAVMLKKSRDINEFFKVVKKGSQGAVCWSCLFCK
jgi:hypothetical protein